jgi:tRNA-specific 2-thiouridylase
VKPFITDYLEGKTPIPCTVCNTEVKFKTLLQKAAALDCEAVATGHYARIGADEVSGAPRLLRARDRSRDQSYFLYDLTEEQLARARFPLGELTKPEVREIAREAGLPNWDKPDSQEVCFVPNGSTPADFIRREAEGLGLSLPAAPGARPGPISNERGEVLGAHDGTMGFTVGQRRGLSLSSSEPLYVIGVFPEASRLVVGPSESLASKAVPLERVHFVGRAEGGGAARVLARIRSRHPEQPALLALGGERSAILTFEAPVRAAAPGQSAVFFDPNRPDMILGGGVIARPAA